MSDKLTFEEALDILGFAMSFGHEPTAKETLEVLRENGYDVVKSNKDTDNATDK